MQVGRRALERLLDGLLSRFVEIALPGCWIRAIDMVEGPFEAVSECRQGRLKLGASNTAIYDDIIELDKLQGRVVRVGAVVPASGCYGAAYLSEVMVLPLSPSHSSVMPSVV